MNDLAVVTKERPVQILEFSSAQTKLLADTIAKGCDENELRLFLEIAKLKRLDPFSGQIRPVKRWDSEAQANKMVIQTGIDGYRSTASRTGELAGIEDAEFDSEKEANPKWAKVTVYRWSHGEKIPYKATARWGEYVQKKKDGNPNSMWLRMPYLMLAKCLPYRAKIKTDMGTLMIGEIVRRRLPVNVLSLNENTGDIEWRPVVNYFRKDGTDAWVKIWAINGYNGNRCIRVTPEHPILTCRGWIEAGKVSITDRVAVHSPTLSQEQEQVIIGSLLGDASLGGRKTGANVRHFVEAHSVKQAEYLRWKFDALENLSPKMRTNKVTVKGIEHDVINLRTKAAPVLHKYARMFYGETGTEKRVTEDILDRLDNLGVAVWIMDDGSIRFDGSTEKSQPYIKLSTCAFSATEQAAIQTFFRSKYGVTPMIEREDGNPNLRFTVTESKTLLTALVDYIRLDRKNNCKEWVAGEIDLGRKHGTAFMPVIRVENYKGRELEGRYDIEVEQNHNFLYNGIVVHNCAEALALRKAFPDELAGVYTDEEMGQADNIIEGQPEQPQLQEPRKQVDMPQAKKEEPKSELFEAAGVIKLRSPQLSKEGALWLTVGDGHLTVVRAEDVSKHTYNVGDKMTFTAIEKSGKEKPFWIVQQLISYKENVEETLPDTVADVKKDGPIKHQEAMDKAFAESDKEPLGDLQETRKGIMGKSRQTRLQILQRNNEAKTGLTREILHQILDRMDPPVAHLEDLDVGMFKTWERLMTGEEDWRPLLED